MSRLRVLVVDDDQHVREALVDLLSTEPSFHVVGSAGDADAAVRVAQDEDPDVVVMDVKMPGGGGPAATRRLAEVRPDIRVLALSAYEDRPTILEMLRAGAVGYIAKGASARDIVEGIQRAGQGLSSLSAGASVELFEELRSRLDADEQVAQRERQQRREVMAAHRALRMEFQPIVTLGERRLVGMEALARFPVEPVRPPNLWFAAAEAIGLGIELEHAALHLALGALETLPADVFLSVNLSPSALLATEMWEDVPREMLARVTVELTEHSPVHDYDELRAALEPLRSAGGRVAVDDTGAGFASLRHIILVDPDYLKLDVVLTRGLHADPTRRALASALTSFAQEIGIGVIAEGIEEPDELATLLELGVPFGQGYHLGRPAPLAAAV